MIYKLYFKEVYGDEATAFYGICTGDPFSHGWKQISFSPTNQFKTGHSCPAPALRQQSI
jgi:hypothetical protein